jgi:hypothetical protein
VLRQQLHGSCPAGVEHLHDLRQQPAATATTAGCQCHCPSAVRRKTYTARQRPQETSSSRYSPTQAA